MWDVDFTIPGAPGRYGSTGAPLVVGDLVITGVSGGDAPLQGFMAAYKATTGQLAWRFRTVPKRGEPGSETWNGKAIDTGGGATWLTGSYDPETGLLYWPTGNPFPDTDRRPTRRRQSLYQLRGGSRSQDGKTALALSIHSARSARLGRHRTAGAGQCAVSGQGAQAAAAGQSQRLLLCAGPDDRRVAVGQAVRSEVDLGQRHRSRRPAAGIGRQQADTGGNQDLSGSARRH